MWKSSTEAKLVGTDDVMPQMLWTLYFLEAQGYKIEDNVLYQDNKSSILRETNKQLEPDDALQSINALETNILTFFSDYNDCFTKKDRTFLWQSLEVPDKFSSFYITDKVHKTPWKPRPITSTAGSITHGFGQWVDQELKPIVHKLPSYIKSSEHLLKRLKNTNFDPSNVSFFSCYAVTMCTNINTNHALEVLEPFLANSPLCTGCPANAVITALDILMRQNVFKLGDTYWKQNSGTAMGTQPGANYAELYYGTWEIEFTETFLENLALYCRYIDDGIGLWIHHPDPDIDRNYFASLQATMNSFGSLEWEFSELCKSINFMDVHLYITQTSIKSRLYKKTMDLYLYLPPRLAHPPDVLTGLTMGMTKRIYALTTKLDDQAQSLCLLFLRLCNRGYDQATLRPLFEIAIKKAHTKKTATIDFEEEKRCYLHLSYHPQDPSSTFVQQTFCNTLLRPSGEPSLFELQSFRGYPLESNRMVIVYHRPHNLKNIPFPRTLKEPDDKPVSSFIPAPLATGI
jgi:hypothetical protein